MSARLDVYLRDHKVGVLDQDDAANLTFTYDESYLASDSPRAISVSMPLQGTPFPNKIARAYFSGLLPDESARLRLAGALGVSNTNAFGMLEIIGGECAGALALYPQGSQQIRQHPADETLDEQQLAALLQELRGNPLLGGRRDVRLSLAGAQDKIAVKLQGDQVVLVKNGAPTTHILKPAIAGLDGTSHNEAFCMTLARRLTLNAPLTRVGTAGDTQYILVERFDRVMDDNGSVQRLHQEDFCQALSMPPELKYEDEGGPGTSDCLDLIQQVTRQPAAERMNFLRMQIFHFLVGNADAHAKNVALLYRLDSPLPSLAPVYDVVCTAIYPSLSKHMAMRIGGRNLPDTIKRQHWLSLVPDTRAAQTLIIKELGTLAKAIGPEADQLLSEHSKTQPHYQVLKKICKLIHARARMILETID